jgi:hypothetical protein
MALVDAHEEAGLGLRRRHMRTNPYLRTHKRAGR